MSSGRSRQPSSSGPNSRDGGPGEAAGYLAEAITELLELARVHRLDMLCYLLDMARMEAREIVRSRRSLSSHPE